MNEEESKKMALAMQDVFGRMLKAGWIDGTAEGHGGVAVRWTEKGSKAARVLRMLFDELGGELTPAQMSAVLILIDRLSPGKTPE